MSQGKMTWNTLLSSNQQQKNSNKTGKKLFTSEPTIPPDLTDFICFKTCKNYSYLFGYTCQLQKSTPVLHFDAANADLNDTGFIYLIKSSSWDWILHDNIQNSPFDKYGVHTNGSGIPILPKNLISGISDFAGKPVKY